MAILFKATLARGPNKSGCNRGGLMSQIAGGHPSQMHHADSGRAKDHELVAVQTKGHPC